MEIGISLSVSRRGGGAAWLPSDLTGLAATVLPALSLAQGKLWQDTAKTIPAVADGDPVRVAVCPFTAVEFTAPSDAARPLLYDEDDGKWSLSFDGVDDEVALASQPFTSGPFAVCYAIQFSTLVGATGIGQASQFGLSGLIAVGPDFADPSAARCYLPSPSGVTTVTSPTGKLSTSSWTTMSGGYSSPNAWLKVESDARLSAAANAPDYVEILPFGTTTFPARPINGRLTGIVLCGSYPDDTTLEQIHTYLTATHP